MIRGYTHRTDRAMMRARMDKLARIWNGKGVPGKGDLVASITPMGGSRVDVKSEKLICRKCSKEFESQYPTTLYCSNVCRRRARESRHYWNNRKYKPCEKCGDSFSHQLSRFCKKCRSVFSKYERYKRNAESRNISFELSVDFFNSFMGKKCSYCGKTSYGIDRIDSSIGYIPDNSTPCCGMCNMMKMTHSQAKFLGHIKKIHDFNFGAL